METNSYINGEVSTLCQDVRLGVKPCALISIKTKDVEEACNICEQEECRYKVKKVINEWLEMWIYGRQELIEIIDNLPEYPSTYADHYLLGALFGYSNEHICNYIQNTMPLTGKVTNFAKFGTVISEEEIIANLERDFGASKNKEKQNGKR